MWKLYIPLVVYFIVVYNRFLFDKKLVSTCSLPFFLISASKILLLVIGVFNNAYEIVGIMASDSY